MMDTQQGGILGITNRSEDAILAKMFAPYFGKNAEARRRKERLVERLTKHLDNPPIPGMSQITFDLHWYPVRDYLVQLSDGKAKGPLYRETVDRIYPEFAKRYEELFGKEGQHLRETVDDYWGKDTLSSYEKAYRPQEVTDWREDNFFSNVRRTEIDVVLETSSQLFIGEAKLESNFDEDKQNVLVHQLIRQYVTAKLLNSIVANPKENIIPFIVCEQGTKEAILKAIEGGLERYVQVRFMVDQGWLDKGNILTWDDIGKIAGTQT